MNIEIKYNPSYAMAIVNLGSGEQIIAEGGAMVSKSPHVGIETHRATKGKGILQSLKVSVLGGESFWMNTFTATGNPGEVTLAPTLPGDVRMIDVSRTLFVQSSSFLAGAPALNIDTQFQGLRGFFSGESLFFLKISGNGPLLISSFGGIEEVQLNGSLVVDTGHIVAFEEGLTYQIKKIGGWKSFFLGGEGLVCHFTGNGRLWIQTRNVPSLTNWLREKLPPKQQ
jgi:uncharacterized protein (TIGR00266 family)